jgi:hypothetical protein
MQGTAALASPARFYLRSYSSEAVMAVLWPFCLTWLSANGRHSAVAV